MWETGVLFLCVCVYVPAAMTEAEAASNAAANT
jgi:hypothetical protein